MSDLVRARLDGVTTTMSRYFAESYGAEVVDESPLGDDGQPRADVHDVIDNAVVTDGYDASVKSDLEAEVDRRNAGLDPSDSAYVTVEGKGNKPDLIAALRAHDAQHPTSPATSADDDTTTSLEPKE